MASTSVAHSAIVTPHLAGLYETARDLVAAERALGLDARIVDPVKPHEGEDRGVPIAPLEFAQGADVIVNHSGLGKLNLTDRPIIHALHGRPYSTFRLEQSGKIAAYSNLRRIAGDPRYRAFVTFWPEFVPYFSLILPEKKLWYASAPVNLEAWSPDGPAGYEWHGKGGEINVVCADVWRDDKDPFHVINAFLLFARRNPGAKLHIYAAPQKGTAWGILKALLREAGVLGECAGFVRGLDNVYRAADVVITPHRMAVRTVREALACGCSVVMAPGNRYTPFRAEPEDIEAFAGMIGKAVNGGYNLRERNRAKAEKHFDPAATARVFVDLIERVCNGGE